VGGGGMALAALQTAATQALAEDTATGSAIRVP
jgi:hypothetical protein